MNVCNHHIPIQKKIPILVANSDVEILTKLSASF